MNRLRGSSWKNDTVIVVDNASYHRSLLVRKALKVLKIRIVLSGPYSYQSSACESLYSLLKRGDFNPE